MKMTASGGGGDRPPVNIELNFVSGTGKSAFAEAREEIAAIKKEIAEINAMGIGGGRGVGGNGGAIGGTSVGGGTRAGGRGVALPNVPHLNPAARTLAEDISRANKQADKLLADMDAADAARAGRWRQGAVNAGQIVGRGVAAGSGSPALGGAIAGGIGSVAGTPWGAGVAAFGALTLGSAALQTPQGGNMTSAFGGWLDNQTRHRQGAASDGFLREFGDSLGGMAFGNVGRSGRAIKWGANWALGGIPGYLNEGWQEQGRTGRAADAADYRRRFNLNQMSGDEARAEAQANFDSSSAMHGVGVSRTLLSARQEQLGQSMGRLNAQATDDPQSGFLLGGQSRVAEIDRAMGANSQVRQAAQEEHDATMGHWRSALEIQTQIMEKRLQEKAIVEQQVNSRVGDLASGSKGDLKRLERAYQDATDGDGKLSRKNAIELHRGGLGNLSGVQDVLNADVQKNAPGLYAHLQQLVVQKQKEADAAQTSVEDFAEKMAGIRDSTATTLKTITDMAAANEKKLNEMLLEAMRQVIDERMAANNVQSSGQVQAPTGGQQ